VCCELKIGHCDLLLNVIDVLRKNMSGLNARSPNIACKYNQE